MCSTVHERASSGPAAALTYVRPSNSKRPYLTTIDVPEGRAIALIEPYARTGAGHWSYALPRLARAAIQDGRPCVVICLNGVSADTHAAIRQTGATVAEEARGQPWALVLLLLARAFRACFYGCRRFSPSAGVTLNQISRALVEAASLQVARSRIAEPCAAVILTSHETLPGFVTKLGGLSHLRFVHELDPDQGRVVRFIERRFRRAACRVEFLCGTGSLAEALQTKIRCAHVRVVPFTTRDPDLYASDAERAAARARLGVERTLVLTHVGSWWKSKDIGTILRALERVNRSVTVLIAGAGIERERLSQHVYGDGIVIRLIDRVLDPEELASVYAASDCMLISRFPDGSESASAYEAVQRGTPLICSNHDPDLTRKLSGQPWARVFRAGDDRDLARVIEGFCDGGVPRPTPDAAEVLELRDGHQQLSMFDRALRWEMPRNAELAA